MAVKPISIRGPKCNATPFYSCHTVKPGSIRAHYLKTPHPARRAAAAETPEGEPA